MYAVLSAKYTTLKTEGNFNNDIGLPRTLFRLNESYGAAVIEMGMSGLGEISVLSKAAAPDICIITNIGWCHIENLKTRENILKAKLEILDGASAEAPLILNGDDEFLKTVDIPGRKIVRYGRGDNCGVRAEDIIQTADNQEFTLVYGGKRYTAKLPVVGEHHVMNALAAFAAGIEAGMTAEEIIPAFLRYEASGMAPADRKARRYHCDTGLLQRKPDLDGKLAFRAGRHGVLRQEVRCARRYAGAWRDVRAAPRRGG